MLKRNYKMKKTIPIKQFASEYGQGFSKHMKQRLVELGTRCILTRRENEHILDLRHVEHIKYESSSISRGKETTSQKEYAYGQFIVNEGNLYFSQSCLENDDVMVMPEVNKIYEALDSANGYSEEGIEAKLVNDANIDFIIDTLLGVCPGVSPEHIAILAKYCNVNDLNCR